MESILSIWAIGCLAFGIFFLPKNAKHTLALLAVVLAAVLACFTASSVLISGEPLQLQLPLNLVTGQPSVVVDELSAFFMLVVSFTSLMGIIYAKGYLAPYLEKKTDAQMSLHYVSYVWLYISMLMVTMFRDGVGFLFVWEIMSLSSFLLVFFDSEKEGNLKIGLNYLIQMHIGFLFIFGGLALTYLMTGSFSFDALSQVFGSEALTDLLGSYGNLMLFGLFFIGFGIKAGFLPLHTWLPHAHPAAPSHVSGVMSGVMIKMGIYGILRVLANVHGDLLPIGCFLLGVSIVSGLFGVMMAIVQHDLKKLLAYHSIENIGIIGIGIGLGVIGKATGNDSLMVLGFAGGLLHVLNHSLFKSLLFFGAGSVYRATHTRDINSLGGLIKKMPKTAYLFLIGALAISGLPPFNGFVSEFLIYSGLFSNIGGGDMNLTITILVSILALALIGGLAIFCFTKAFGMVFLGTNRKGNLTDVEEASGGMLTAKFLIVVLIVAIGILPLVFVQALQPVLSVMGVSPNLFTSLINPSGALTQLPIVLGILVAIFIALWVWRSTQQKRVAVVHGPTWGCGYTGADPALHQYTATSFADNYKMLAKPVVGVEKHDMATYPIFEEEEIFPNERQFETHTYDKIERNLVDRPTNWLTNTLTRFATLQTGEIRHYLIYPLVFLLLIFILSLAKII